VFDTLYRILSNVLLVDRTGVWTKLWGKFWGKGLENLKNKRIEAHSIKINGKPVYFNVMETQKAFQLSLVIGLLILNDWEVTWSHAIAACDRGVLSFILVVRRVLVCSFPISI